MIVAQSFLFFHNLDTWWILVSYFVYGLSVWVCFMFSHYLIKFICHWEDCRGDMPFQGYQKLNDVAMIDYRFYSFSTVKLLFCPFKLVNILEEILCTLCTYLVSRTYTYCIWHTLLHMYFKPLNSSFSLVSQWLFCGLFIIIKALPSL